MWTIAMFNRGVLIQVIGRFNSAQSANDQAEKEMRKGIGLVDSYLVIPYSD